MTKIRIPTRCILEMSDKIRTDPGLCKLVFVSDGGNKLEATRKRGLHKHDSQDVWDSWDFEYNPGD